MINSNAAVTKKKPAKIEAGGLRISPGILAGGWGRGERGERGEVGGGRWEVGGGRWEVGGGRWEVGGGRWEVSSGSC
jgi:hypothetical protein